MNDHATPSTVHHWTAVLVAACHLALLSTPAPPAAALGENAPAVEGQVPAKHLFVLGSAYSVARGRLAEVDSCASLFSALGADGLQQLSGAVFYLASSEQEQRICHGRRADAFTEVGGSRIGLCAGFSELTRWKAAVRLIHEALHHAGMTEQPADPRALTSREINQLVRESCGL